MPQKSKRWIYAILGGLLCANIIAFYSVYNLSTSNSLKIIFFDVGQGDSEFIETSCGHQILIDGGPDLSVLDKLSKEMPFFDRTIDLIILSHPEKDHIFGLIEVLKRYKVENIVWTGVETQTPEFYEWKKLISTEGANVRTVKAKDVIAIDCAEQIVSIEIINPESDLNNQKFPEPNNTSIVLKLVFGKTSFLFPGDVDRIKEKELLGKIGQASMLKIAHHGSKTSSSEEFLKEVNPKTAIIEVGDNNYGHPSQEVLERLDKFGIQVFRTDKNGDIKIISSGDNIKINN